MGLTTRDDDDEQQHDYGHDNPDPHFHILPPHLLADSVGAAAKALGRLVEVFGFVLQLVDVFAALGNRFEVLFHDVDGVIDLLLIESGFSDCTLERVRIAYLACAGMDNSVNGGGFVMKGA